MAASNSVDKLIVIVGETASGKSKLALELARKFNGEIISADSWTVYRGFDIGTAKPSEAERVQIPHHLIDIVYPNDGFSAAEFKRLATLVIQEIVGRGKLPILVGGTGLYIDSVIYDYGFLPAGSAGERGRLDKLSIEELLTEIKSANIDTEGIDIRNKRRLVRLLETSGQRPTKSKLRPHTLILGLSLPKETLESQITKRVENMLSAGLEQEVRQLAKSYGWAVEPMKGIGYREFRGYLEGQQTLEETKEQIVRSSLQLAKKQRTWFRRNKSIHWLQKPEQATGLVQKFLSK